MVDGVSCRGSLVSMTTSSVDLADLGLPFGTDLANIGEDDLRETAYEIFFLACRSSPGFGARNAASSSHPDRDTGSIPPASPKGVTGNTLPASPRGNTGTVVPVSPRGNGNGVGMAVTSRVKRALGLKMMRRSASFRRDSSVGSDLSHGSGVVPTRKGKRPMTSAEIMRHQMRVTEQSDNRLRKTLVRTLFGQMSRRTETIIFPLALLRHIKPSEFNDSHEYHTWQKRQLSFLEAGLILHPSIPLDNSDELAVKLIEIIRMSKQKPIETTRNSETMKTLSNCVVALSCRTQDMTTTTDVCQVFHWADGYPLNVQIYISLLHSIFDLRDECLVLDEVDELLELMKKTWSMLGVNRSFHNLCLTWVFFRQYVTTGYVETDLLGATVAMLNEVASDAKKEEREHSYMEMLSRTLVSLKKLGEKKLINYHNVFDRGTIGSMEYYVPLVVLATRILEEDVFGVVVTEVEKEDMAYDPKTNKVDRYIRSSLKHAFAKLLENQDYNGLAELAKDTEQLVLREKEIFTVVLKKWHPVPTGIASVTLHNCYGTLLKQYLDGVSSLSKEVIEVLHSAGELEKALVNIMVEDSVECEDAGKAVMREMVPYEVDSLIMNLVRQWIQERVEMAKECLQRAKETETWDTKSKTEPYAQSSVDLLKIVKRAVDDFLEIPFDVSEDLVYELTKSFEPLFHEYTNFIASCDSKQSYVPTLPPLTRCSRDSKFIKLCKKATPCGMVVDDLNQNGENNQTRSSTSRGTQRLYIRLNTLHYFLSNLHVVDKSLSLSSCILPSLNNRRHLSYFETACIRLENAIHYVSEVVAYRLIFLDSNHVFYDTLYVRGVENTRLRNLKILKQNLTLLTKIVTDGAQPLVMKEAIKASYEAFLMVLLAGGSSRAFLESDSKMIEEDFGSLKRIFVTWCKGLIAKSVVEQEAAVVEGVVALMGKSSERLIEEFRVTACEASAIGVVGAGQKLPMPPTTGKWNGSDPNTILRVLCHRNDREANHFLKMTFQLPKR